jgi:hypothetical protein
MRLSSKGFDWKSHQLTFENTEYSLFQDFMGCLVLPSLDYCLPSLDVCKFPTFFLENPNVWKSVFLEFVPQHEQMIDNFHDWNEEVHSPSRVQAIDMSERDGYTGDISTDLQNFDRKYRVAEFDAYLRSWKTFIKLLADRAGKNNAIEVERWIYRHYISSRYNDAMSGWMCLFYNAKVIPDFLEPVIQGFYELFNTDERFAICEESNALYCRYREENDLDGKELNYSHYTHHHRPPYYAYTSLFEKIFTHMRVSEVMRILATTLNTRQIDILMQWVESMVNDEWFESTNFQIEKIYGKELISTVIPFSNYPSILEGTH